MFKKQKQNRHKYHKMNTIVHWRLGNFGTNYIIFRNAEILKDNFL